MTGSSWAVAALVCVHLSSVGALPPEVSVSSVQGYATGEQPIRVLVANGASSLTLRATDDFVLEDPATRERLAVVKAGASLRAQRAGSCLNLTGPGLRLRATCLRLSPLMEGGELRLSVSGGWGRDGIYPGALELAPATNGRGLRAVEHVNLETYVAGVVASEMPASFPLEAMKAQAVAARTYALYHLGGHDSDEADICASVHCQAYGGRPPSNSRAAQAAQDTAGQVLLWEGLLLDAMYSAACGGRTATAWDIRQGKLLPYLVGHPDAPYLGGAPYCSLQHDITWSRRVTMSEARRSVARNLAAVTRQPGVNPGTLETMSDTKDPDQWRTQWLKVYTSNGAYRVRGDAIRWLFGVGYPGPGGLRSTAFDLTIEERSDGRPAAFVFTGAGHGHGLGLCQWGARGRAMSDQGYVEILAAYYPGAMLADLSP
ncbi:MAG: SpoIID/LytB domain-containing protein [Armatimonadetes bacterium]|nr:SpoIID/LytB domain-containing protein [Armatimonadota bacterium]